MPVSSKELNETEYALHRRFTNIEQGIDIIMNALLDLISLESSDMSNKNWEKWAEWKRNSGRVK